MISEEWELEEEEEGENLVAQGKDAEESKELKDQNTADAVKSETAAAYNRVGETAHHKGDLLKAARVMTALDYTKEEIAIAGEDAYNF